MRCAELLSLVGPEIERLIAGNDDYSRISLPIGTNATPPRELVTFAVQATVITLATIDDEIIDAFVRNTLMNLDTLRQKVPILAALNSGEMRSMSLSAPLHPAAARAFDRSLAGNQ
jgi:TRAP-type uncharacterized transport system substrate-binding protein